MLALMAVAGVIALFPSGPDYYLGIGDELGMLRAVLAVLLVGVAAGMVWVSWWLLVALMWPLRLLGRGSIQRYDVSQCFYLRADDRSAGNRKKSVCDGGRLFPWSWRWR